jgi:4'-phosphopantetheinyl transferase EntD
VVAAAAAPRSVVPALGIDVEAAEPLGPDVQETILAPGEERGPEPWWPAVVFSAKESVFKALHGEVGEWIPFEAVRVVRGPGPGELRAEGTGWAPPGGAPFEPERLRGGWRAGGGRVVTAVWRRASGTP